MKVFCILIVWKLLILLCSIFNMHKKKVLVIIIGVFSLVLLSAGIFLLWKVNKKDETLSPTGSSASGNTCDAKGAKWQSQPVSLPAYPYGEKGGRGAGFNYMTGDSDGVDINSITVDVDGIPVTDVTKTAKADGRVEVDGYVSKDTNGKYLMPGVKTLTIKWKDTKGAGAVAPCLVSTKFTISNVCDAIISEWETNPDGKIFDNCASIPFSYITSDTDGVKPESIKITIDGQQFTNFQQTAVGTKGIKVSGDLKNGAGNTCLTAGRHVLDIKWTDKYDVGNDCPCYASSEFNVEGRNNVCDAGSNWGTNGKPTGEYKYCQTISYSALLKDSDGISDKPTVTLNGKTRNTKVTPINAQSSTITETLATTGQCLAPGSYNLVIKWTDKLGVGDDKNCVLKTSFTVAKEPQPDMTITKIPKETCIDNNTENVKSELSYTIKIKNNGQGEGKISNITDTLDPKVVPSSITNISNGGKVVGQKIVWDLTGTDQVFAQGQEKEYTYKYTVQKEALGQYDNKVVATVEKTDTQPSTKIEAKANIPTSCEGPGTPPPPAETPTVPTTGIFDNSLIIVGAGAIIMIIGLAWDWLSPTSGIFINKYRANKKKTFEKKVTKEA